MNNWLLKLTKLYGMHLWKIEQFENLGLEVYYVVSW